MLLAQPGSWHWRRSEFAEHPIWVTKYQDQQVFPAGDYTNQSIGGTGVKSWTDRPDHVVDEDIVIWHIFGFNHTPRVEDFPVVPAGITQMHLKPYNFCAYEPTNDVPLSTQAFNRSVLYDDMQQGIVSTNGIHGREEAKPCCDTKTV